jgi:TonB family protein
MKNKIHVPKNQIKQPVFPGGRKALDEFIKQHLKYPETALEHKVQGTVSVDYDIDIFGEVISAKVKHGIGYGCDEEALRLVKLLRFSKKRYQGMHVVFHQNMNIHFRLPGPPPPPPQQAITYHIKIEPKSGDQSGLTYTINLK